jgi:hypothetical protein
MWVGILEPRSPQNIAIVNRQFVPSMTNPRVSKYDLVHTRTYNINFNFSTYQTILIIFEKEGG